MSEIEGVVRAALLEDCPVMNRDRFDQIVERIAKYLAAAL